MKPFFIGAIMAAALFVTAAAAQDSAGNAVSTREVILFFDDAGALKPEMRDIPQHNFIEPEIQAVVEQLIKGSDNYTRTIPRSAKLKRAFVDSRNIVYLDFNARFKKDHPGGIACEILTLASLARTIFANFDATGVQILSEGKEMETLAGHLDISRPLSRAEVRKWTTQKRKRRKK
jgi:germination protein M